MDVNDFKAFVEASELTVRPYKYIIWALIGALVLFIAVFGGAFYYFMYRAFNTEPGYSIAQTMENSNGSVNNVE